METSLTNTNQNTPAPFGQGQQPGRGMALQVNAGAVAIESERAIAEARGQIQVAQMFPRDVTASRAEFMEECDNLEFATAAIYSVPQAGGKVSGPSIRFAEECARCYGHMEYGHRELSRSDRKSEVEVYAWDKQKNNRSIRQITVEHTLDTKDGPRKLRDQRDVDNKIANVASKQVRGRILALVPKSFVEAGLARCKQTVLGGGGVPLKQRVIKMTEAFTKLGVTAEILKKHLGHSLDTVDGEELVDLTAIHNAIKNGDKISDHFAREDKEDDGQASTLAETAKNGAAAATQKPVKTTKPAAAADAAPTGQDAAGEGKTAAADPGKAKAAEAAKPAPAAADVVKNAAAQTKTAEADSKTVEKVSKPTEEASPPAAANTAKADDKITGSDDGDFF